eukprot:GHVT01016098.1.p2 GENE.GHVT01016098.1~~GHVT01016098.1.p2  ORF type:complete len:308 (-),score=54.52 GHVT01016098.1:790-1713(-)
MYPPELKQRVLSIFAEIRAADGEKSLTETATFAIEYLKKKKGNLGNKKRLPLPIWEVFQYKALTREIEKYQSNVLEAAKKGTFGIRDIKKSDLTRELYSVRKQAKKKGDNLPAWERMVRNVQAKIDKGRQKNPHLPSARLSEEEEEEEEEEASQEEIDQGNPQSSSGETAKAGSLWTSADLLKLINEIKEVGRKDFRRKVTKKYPNKANKSRLRNLFNRMCVVKKQKKSTKDNYDFVIDFLSEKEGRLPKPTQKKAPKRTVQSFPTISAQEASSSAAAMAVATAGVHPTQPTEVIEQTPKKHPGKKK